MATSGNTSSNGYQGRYIYFEWWTKSVSSANNTRTIGYKFTAKGGSSSSYYHHNNVFQLNGNTVYTGGQSDYIKTDTVLAQGDYTINQSSTNKLRVDMDGGIYSYGNNINTADEWTLDDIPRYAKATISLNSRTLNTIKISYSVDATIDGIWVSKNGGDWQGGYALTSPINITGLSPNTKYTLKIRVKRKDSQLYSESNSIDVTTFDIAKLVSVPNVNIGSAQTITWTNPSGAATTLKLCRADTANTQIANIGTVTGTSKSYTATASTIYALTPNSNTYKARYILTTTQNGQSYTNSKDFNFIVTNSNPTFSNFTYQDTNATTVALTGSNQILVKGYSKVKAIVTVANKAIAKNSATMKTYKLVIGSQSRTNNYSSAEDVYLPASGAVSVDSGTLTVYATDSRTNSTSVTKNATYKQYSDLTIKSVTAVRDSNGVGKGVTLSFNGSYWAQNFGTGTNSVTNTIKSVTYQYRNSSSSTWHTGTTTLTYTQSNGNYSGSLKIKGEDAEGFNISNSYVIRLTVKDELSTKTYDVTLSSGTPAIAIYKSKVAIGKKYDTSDDSTLQVNGKINGTGLGTNLANAIVNKIYPVGSIYISVNNTNPKNLFGGTWEQLKNAFLYANAGTSYSSGNGTGTTTNASTGSTGGPSTNTSGSTTLTINQIPAHSHSVSTDMAKNEATGFGLVNSESFMDRVIVNGTTKTGNAGGGQGHTHTLSSHTHSLNSHKHNIPYLAVFVWKRTA